MNLLLGYLFNFNILGYYFILNKTKEDFKLTKSDVWKLSIVSILLQTGCFFCFRNVNALIYFCITYLIIQGYTDYKTKFVYRFVSCVFGCIDIIFIIIFHNNIDGYQVAFLLSTLILLLIFSCCGFFGLGDTISIGVSMPVYLITYGEYATLAFLMTLFVSCISFVFFNGMSKVKRNPFMPHWSIGFLMVFILLSVSSQFLFGR